MIPQKQFNVFEVLRSTWGALGSYFRALGGSFEVRGRASGGAKGPSGVIFLTFRGSLGVFGCVSGVSREYLESFVSLVFLLKC